MKQGDALTKSGAFCNISLFSLLPSGRQVRGFGRDGRGFEAFVLKKIIIL